MGHLLSPTEHAREEDRCTENDTGGARKGRPNDGGPADPHARRTDAPQITRLHLASYQAGYRDLLPTAFLAPLTLADRERRWRASLRDPARQTLIVGVQNADGPALVAFAEVGACRDDDAAAGAAELIALHVAADGRARDLAASGIPIPEVRYGIRLG